MLLVADLRLALRSLRREPGIALLAILMLGLGLGATTAVFSLVNGVLLNPLPYPQPDQLITIREVIPRIADLYPSLPVNARHFVEWRKDCQAFGGMSAFEAATLNLTGSGEPERLDVARVSPNLFRVLAVRPVLGRDFRDDEESESATPVVILTDGLWRRRFHADPSLLGRTMALDGRSYTVIGILAPDFRFPDRNLFGLGESVAPRTELFTIKKFDKEELAEILGRHNYGVVARVRPGVSREQAVSQLEAVQARMETLAGEQVGLRAIVRPLLDSVVGKARAGLLVLMGAIAALLLIVCVNLANLLLARAERRSREISIRAALGAGRAALIRHALSESALLALGGGVLSLAVAAAGIQLFRAYGPRDIPRLDEVSLDARVLVFSGALMGLTALSFGLLPAWRAGRADPQDTLRSMARGATASRAGVRLRSGLVTCEVGLSALLLLLAGLLSNSLFRLLHADQGFSAPTVLAVDIGLSRDKYQDPNLRDSFYRRLFETLASEPGVESASIISALPLRGETWVDGVSAVASRRSPEVQVNVRFIGANYFRTMGIPLVAGRSFNDNDRGRQVSVISRRLAAALWPGQEAVGRRFTRGNNQWFDVIGVAGDVRAEAHLAPVAMMYRPYWDWMPFRTVLVARATASPLSIAGAVRVAIHSADPDVPVPRMRTMSEVLAESVASRRFQMLLAMVFAAIALIVAGLGIYAVVSYSVARRTAELGIRTALGARVPDLYLLILRQGMTPVVMGLAFAVAAALAFGRFLASMLYEIGGRDPLTLVVVVAALALVALAACVVPARGAARLDPLTALRHE